MKNYKIETDEKVVCDVVITLPELNKILTPRALENLTLTLNGWIKDVSKGILCLNHLSIEDDMYNIHLTSDSMEYYIAWTYTPYSQELGIIIKAIDFKVEELVPRHEEDLF